MYRNDLDSLFRDFDFTDSIITNITTFSRLTEITIEIDYYWDLQEGKEETRILLLVFKKCKSIEFVIPEIALDLLDSNSNIDSYYTIEKVILEDNNKILFYNGTNRKPFVRIEFGIIELYENNK